MQSAQRLALMIILRLGQANIANTHWTAGFSNCEYPLLPFFIAMALQWKQYHGDLLACHTCHLVDAFNITMLQHVHHRDQAGGVVIAQLPILCMQLCCGKGTRPDDLRWLHTSNYNVNHSVLCRRACVIVSFWLLSSVQMLRQAAERILYNNDKQACTHICYLWHAFNMVPCFRHFMQF